VISGAVKGTGSSGIGVGVTGVVGEAGVDITSGAVIETLVGAGAGVCGRNDNGDRGAGVDPTPEDDLGVKEGEGKGSVDWSDVS
jgi:hypothetical protein